MHKTWEMVSDSTSRTFDIGATIGRVLRPGDAVLLEGDLGAGKTVLAKGIVSAATGVSPDDVVSPTFTLINTFDGRFPVNHADLYRIGSDQVEGIGLEEALDDGAIVVEWAEKAANLAEDPLRIDIAYADDEESRKITVTAQLNGSWPPRLREALGGTADDPAERR